MLLSELGATLRKARKERRLTLKQVAEQAGVHFTTLSSLERGAISELGVRKLLRVVETLGLELVMRPAGQRFTLDDVAKERGGMLSSGNPSHREAHKWGSPPGASQDEQSGMLSAAPPSNRGGWRPPGDTQDGQGGMLSSVQPSNRKPNIWESQPKSQDQKGGLLARALRGPLVGSSNAGGEARASLPKHKRSK